MLGDIMETLMTQGGRGGGGSQSSCGCGAYFRPWGSLIWLPGKPPSAADRESHREGSCPAVTDRETNGLWNSVSCETREGRPAQLYTVMPALQSGSAQGHGKWLSVVLGNLRLPR